MSDSDSEADENDKNDAHAPSPPPPQVRNHLFDMISEYHHKKKISHSSTSYNKSFTF